MSTIGWSGSGRTAERASCWLIGFSAWSGGPAILPEHRSGNLVQLSLGFVLLPCADFFARRHVSGHLAPDRGLHARPLAPGQRRRRVAALPKTPCRASVTIPLTTSGAASPAGATEQGAPHEAGLDPVVVAADAATRCRFAVPEHHSLPGSARPVA